MRFVELEQTVLERRELKEPALFLHALQLALALGTKVLAFNVVFLIGLLHLRLRVVGLLVHAVPAIVGVLVDVAGILHEVPQMLNGGNLAWLRSADEVVV